MEAFMIAVFGAVCTVMGGIVIRLYDRRQSETDQIKREKRELADKILGMLNEARCAGFKIAPRDSEHVHRLMSDMSEWDGKFSNDLHVFFIAWVDYVKFLRGNTELTGRAAKDEEERLKKDLKEMDADLTKRTRAFKRKA